MGLQVGNGYNEWPDVLPESHQVDCPSLPTSSCTWCLFSWVALWSAGMICWCQCCQQEDTYLEVMWMLDLGQL